MHSFHYERATDPQAAVALARQEQEAQYLAGGTTLLDLMKLAVVRPASVVDINDLKMECGAIEAGPEGLRLGALVRMSEAAEHTAIRRDYPVIAQSLQLAASPQLRNMATLGGNVLQRTRCSYFRDPSWRCCNKRDPGSGCAALEGVNRRHAVLGTSRHCIATYPGDFAQALVALEATVCIAGTDATRRLPFEELHVEPGDRPDIETVLAPGELITAFEVPQAPLTRRSIFLKVRDRESYDFALASAAVALDLESGSLDLRDARISLGGVATRPWRAREAEELLRGKRFTVDLAAEAATAAFAAARTQTGNAFKVELGQRCLVEALVTAAAMEI